MAAPAYRSHNVAATNSATLTITKPTGTASGDLLIAHILHVTGGQSIDPTAPTGFTLLGARQSNSSCTQWWFTKVAGGSEPASYDWTGLPSNFQIGSLTAISGGNTSNPIDVSQVTQNTDIAATSVALSVTTTGADRLLWASASIDASATTTFSQSSMTERWDESLSSFSFLSQAGYTGAAATAGTYNRDISIDVAQRIAGALIAINPASGTPVEIALETDTGQAVGRQKRRVQGIATTTDSAIAFGRRKVRALGIGLETDVAVSIVGTAPSADPAVEADTAQPLGRRKVKAIGTAVETEFADGVTAVKKTTVVKFPTYKERLGEGRLLGRYTKPEPVSLIKKAGVWSEIISPHQDEIAAAEKFYQGGHRRALTPAEAADLPPQYVEVVFS